jgi:hypothetical protein
MYSGDMPANACQRMNILSVIILMVCVFLYLGLFALAVFMFVHVEMREDMSKLNNEYKRIVLQGEPETRELRRKFQMYLVQTLGPNGVIWRRNLISACTIALLVALLVTGLNNTDANTSARMFGYVLLLTMFSAFFVLQVKQGSWETYHIQCHEGCNSEPQ